jgi:FtsH-binding integral membrane protein
MSEPSNFKDVLRKNRNILLAILMLPVVGMAIAIPLIIWRVPGVVKVAVPIILVLMAQYILLVVWISKKMNQMIES